MKTIKSDSLKLYKNKLETYIPDLLETTSEFDIKKTPFKNKTKI